MIELVTRAAGFFKIEAVRPDGRRRILADWFPNLIVNGGLDMMMAASAETGAGTFATACQVGTGNTAPATTQTALASYLAGTSTQQSSVTGFSAGSPYYGYARRVYRFAAGVAAGNLAEVGIARTTTTGNLLSRALILDGGGSPTTITVLGDEFLDVTYELRQYAPVDDVAFELTIGAVTHDVVARAARVTTSPWNGAMQGLNQPIGLGGSGAFSTQTLGAVTSNPAGTIYGQDSGSYPTYGSYSAGTYYRDGVHSWGLNNGNAPGGIGSICSPSGRGQFQFSLDPVIAKDNTKVLTLTVRLSIARYTIP